MANISQITLPDGTTYDLKDVDSESYAPKSSPALTGTPTAPTATSGTNSTQIATTAFVQGAVSSAIGNVNSFEVSVVQSLPTTNIDPHTIYFISNSGSTGNIYDEYMYINSNWEKIGTTDVDLSGYLAKNNTTTFTPTGDYNPATKKYVDDKLFVVNITSTTTEGVTTYSANKTFAEITTAVEAGKQVTAINNNYVYYYTWKNNSDIIFHSKTLTLFSSTSQITNRTFRIHNDEVVSLYTNTFQNKLTFDSTPTENSTNPVTSGGVYTALANAGSNPDWDENDSTSDAYIANRTHYRTSVGSMSNLHPLINESSTWSERQYTGQSGNVYSFYSYWQFDFNDYDSLMSDFPDGLITLLDLENPEIVVIADETELELTYVKKPITDSEYNIYVFYNNDFEIAYADDNSGYMPAMFRIASNTEHESIQIKLKKTVENFEYHTLDDRYLNGSLIKSGTGTQSEIFNGITPYETYQIYITGDGNDLEYTFATPGEMPPERLSYCASAIKVEGHDDVEVVNIEFDSDHNHYGITFNKTFDAELPVEDYPITIIVPSKIASGNGSHLEGYASIASGVASHAEGEGTVASGFASHAEGVNTTASGNYSHAEGGTTTASGSRAHAEGSSTTASDDGSHAEGHSTVASGMFSHAEGNFTTASGNNSHAEGNFTTAQRRSQHVFGEFNVLDRTGTKTSVKGSYVEIVGNGTADNARSNARTLDWSGNEVLAGKLTVGAAPTNNMDVTTKQYVDNSISTAMTNINSFNTAIVQSLPTTDIDTHTIYFISNSGSGTNVYDEYIYINSNWEKIGSTSIDLSNYLAKDNTTSYTPTGDYNPATKKYVDDAMDDTYIVNFSFSEPSDVIVSDKYRDEVVLAKINEKKIIGYLDNIPYNYCGDYFYATALIDNTYPTIMFLVWDDGIPETVNTLTLHEYDVDAQAYITNVLTKTNTTSYTPTGDYNPATKKYVDDKSIMVVEISQTYENGNAVYSSNKTFAEIAAHINNGGDIICVPLFHSEREFYTIANVTQTTIEFNNTTLRYNDNTNEILYSCDSIIISNDNTVSNNGGIGGSLVEKSTTTPLAPGTASIGTEYAYASGDHVHPSELFVVNISSTTTEGVTTYTANKTFAEITAAYNAGKECICKYSGYVYQLYEIYSNEMFFSRITTSVVDTAETIYVTTIKIDSIDDITVKSRTAFSYHGSRNVHPYKEQIAKVNATNYTLANLYKGIVNYNTSTATQAYSTGDLFWLNYNVLVKATTDIASGAALTENTNYVKTTIADELKSGGGSSTLVDLVDTTITSPTNGQVLMYNSTTSKWENTSLPIYNGGVSS